MNTDLFRLLGTSYSLETVFGQFRALGIKVYPALNIQFYLAVPNHGSRCARWLWALGFRACCDIQGPQNLKLQTLLLPTDFHTKARCRPAAVVGAIKGSFQESKDSSSVKEARSFLCEERTCHERSKGQRSVFA